MAFGVKKEDLEKNKDGSANKETKHIPAGNRLARLVSYVELGKHLPMFQGKRAVFEAGKNKGKEKPAVFHVGLTFEFPTCEYTGDYPLTISTTRQMKNGEFFDAVTIPDSLLDGTISLTMAMKTKFMKFLTGLQAAAGKDWPSIADFAEAQVPLIINVTNKKGAKDEEGHTPIYANMKPEGIMSPKVEDPVTGVVTDYADKVPPAIGEYCTVFDWENPTAEAWQALKPWDKDTIKKAVDFEGSPIHALLESNPELNQLEEQVNDQSDNTPAEPTVPGQAPKQEDMPV